MSTYINSLRLVNFRNFKKTDFEFDSDICVFLGDNGSGKTSVLDAISILISEFFPLCNCTPKLKSIPYSNSNVRSWTEIHRGRQKLKMADVTGIVGSIVHESEDSFKSLLLSIGRKLKTEEDLSVDTQKDLANYYTEHVDSDLGIPVFAHYGPHRGAKQGSRKRFGQNKIDYSNPFSAYNKALDPSLDFDSFLDWFNEEEISELRNQRNDRSYVNKDLEAVRSALVRVFESGGRSVTNPRFEANPKRFVMTETLASGEVYELNFDQLSDGYRGIIALVADFARRLVIANQYSEIEPLNGDGILMIDEVDAHLHPKWQYRVIEDLKRTFPNVQLLVTTHSPEVVSTIDKKNIYVLKMKDGSVSVSQPQVQTNANFLEDIAECVMSVPNNQYNHPAFKAYLACINWIDSGKCESDDFQGSYQIVYDHYGADHSLTQEIDARKLGWKRLQGLVNKIQARK